MKRYYLALTIGFALSACAGGGGSSSSYGTAVPSRPAVSDAAIESNRHITSMSSEILIPKGGSGSIIARSGNVNYNGETYTSYRLDDVTFRFAGEDSVIRFKVNEEGRIISAGKYDRKGSVYALSDEGLFDRTSETSSEFGSAKTMYGWEQELTANNADLIATIKSAIQGKTLPEGKNADDFAAELAGYIAGQFADPVEVQSDSASINVGDAFASEISDEINDWAASQKTEGWQGSEWLTAAAAAAITYYQGLLPDTFEAPGEYVAKLNVRGADIGLKYADLGFAELQVAEKDNPSHIVEQTFAPYAGGYNKLERNVGATTEFTGTALAGVEHTAANGDKDSVLVRQDDAVLTLNVDGSSQLVMDNLVRVGDDGKTYMAGQNWYELTVERAANGEPTFTVGGENNITGYNLLNVPEDPVVFTAGDYNASEREYEISDTENGVRYGGFVENHVYGTGESDIEAVSQFGFSNENTNTHEEVAIYGVFGGQPTPAE